MSLIPVKIKDINKLSFWLLASGIWLLIAIGMASDSLFIVLCSFLLTLGLRLKASGSSIFNNQYSIINNQFKRTYLTILFAFFIFTSSFSQQLAFPGADGFGKYVTGGRGGIVVEVTNLNDNGPGSLRAALTINAPRTIVFRVSGTIYLQSRLSISRGNVTIAGQTAPGDGITLANYNVNINSDNIIIRYIRCRLGDVYQQADDAFTCTERKNIIIDHCSISWSLDEAGSFYLNENFTLQYCILSESLYKSYHPKGLHGYGGIWGGMKASFHHNLLAHHTSRNPRFNGARYRAGWNEEMDFRNNVIYNWGFNSAYGGEPSELDGNKAKINIVANYYKPGPATNIGQVSYRILEPSSQPLNNWGYSFFYVDSNYVVGSPQTTADNWTYGVQNVAESVKAAIKSSTPFAYLTNKTETAEDAYINVLNNVGANLPKQDTIDKRIIWEVANTKASFGASYGPGSGIIDSQNDVGGYPELFSAPAPIDTDHDGMPDSWETIHNLNPSDSTDRNSIINNDGYTALEVYLNGISNSQPYLSPPSKLQARLADPRTIKLSWKDNTNEETGFILERKTSGNYVLLDSLTSNTNSYIDSNLNAKTKYTYRLKAYNSSIESVFSSESSLTTPLSAYKPKVAYNLKPDSALKNTQTLLALTWSKGQYATDQQLYFDTIYPPRFLKNTTDTFFKTPILKYNKKYYWRINSSNDYDTTESSIYNFTVREAIKEKLVGHWTFDESMKITDSSEFLNNGEITNLQAKNFRDTGAIRGSVFFNGTEQYIKVPHNLAFDFDINSFSISFWLLQDSLNIDRSQKYSYILKGSHNANENLGRTGKRYELAYFPFRNEFVFNIDDNSKQSEVSVNENVIILGKWVHVVAIRNTKSKTLQLCVNNRFLAEATDATENISQNEDLFFGNSIDEVAYLNGGFDDIRLYGYALSKSEIDSLYKLKTAKPVIIPNPDFVDENKLSQIAIYPNPLTSSKLYLKTNYTQTTELTISLADISGRELFNLYKSESLEKGSNSLILNIPTNIANGLYILKVETPNRLISRKLQITR